MSGGFQFFDIIIFGLIAVFIILRLRGVLGRRTGNERPNDQDMFSRDQTPPHSQQDRKPNGEVVHLPDRNAQREPDDDFEPAEAAGDDIETASKTERTGIKAGITLIRVADPDFSPRDFVEGAKSAFEMIVEAFAEGDTPTLRPLLGDDVYDEFSAAIRERMAAQNTAETTIISLDDASLVGADIRGSTARITIKFVSQQVNVTRDADENVIGGHPEKVVRITDIWTFARNTRSNNLNWMLVETRAE